MNIPILHSFSKNLEKSTEIDDVVLGAFGKRSVDEIGACKSPVAILNECTYVSVRYDDYILLLLTDKLTARERYNFKSWK